MNTELRAPIPPLVDEYVRLLLKLASEASHGREDLLDRIERALGLVNETAARGSTVCPECGGPKSAYATRCIKHNAGTVGNPGGPGGDRSSPAAITAGVGESRQAQPVVDTRSLTPEQRTELATVLAHGKGTDVARVVKLQQNGEESIAAPKRRGRPPGANHPWKTKFDTCPECEVYKKPVSQARCANCARRHEAKGERIPIGEARPVGHFGTGG